MSRIYTVSFENISVSAVQDLLEITPADDKPIRLKSLLVTVRDSETNEQFTSTIKRASGAYTSGSGGGSPTIAKASSIDGTVGFAAERNNTTRATGGTIENLHVEGWPSQGGLNVTPLPGCEFTATHGEALIVGLENAPAGATGFNATAVIEELP
jgi:hypothetical protein